MPARCRHGVNSTACENLAETGPVAKKVYRKVIGGEKSLQEFPGNTVQERTERNSNSNLHNILVAFPMYLGFLATQFPWHTYVSNELFRLR